MALVVLVGVIESCDDAMMRCMYYIENFDEGEEQKYKEGLQGELLHYNILKFDRRGKYFKLEYIFRQNCS